MRRSCTDWRNVAAPGMEASGPRRRAITSSDVRVRVSGEVKHCGHTGLLHRQTRRAGRFDQVVSLPGKFEITAA